MDKAHRSQETPARGEPPVPEDQFNHGYNPWSSWFGIELRIRGIIEGKLKTYASPTKKEGLRIGPFG